MLSSVSIFSVLVVSCFVEIPPEGDARSIIRVFLLASLSKISAWIGIWLFRIRVESKLKYCSDVLSPYFKSACKYYEKCAKQSGDKNIVQEMLDGFDFVFVDEDILYLQMLTAQMSVSRSSLEWVAQNTFNEYAVVAKKMLCAKGDNVPDEEGIVTKFMKVNQFRGCGAS